MLAPVLGAESLDRQNPQLSFLKLKLCSFLTLLMLQGLSVLHP